MRDMNSFSCTGYVGKDAELRYNPNGTPVLRFNVAVGNDRYDKKTDQTVKQTDWVPVVLFGKRAEALQKFITKGRRLLVQGRVSIRTYKDKEGASRTGISVIPHLYDGIQFLNAQGPKSEAEATGNPELAEAVDESLADVADDVGGDDPAF